MVIKSKIKSCLSVLSRLTLLSFGIVALTFLPVQAQQKLEPKSSSNSIVTEQVALQNLLYVKQNEKKKKTVPNTATTNQPTISNAKVVTLMGADSSRAYFFESEQKAESFANVIAAFKVATRIKVVISETESMVFDNDRKRMVMPRSYANQLRIDTNTFVLLAGTRKEHARVEELMRALGAE